MKIKKQAQKRSDPSPVDRAFVASMLRKGRDEDNLYIKSQIEAGEERREAEMKRELEMRASRYQEQAKRNVEWVEEFEKSLGMPFQEFEPAKVFAERMKVANSMQFGNVSRMMNACVGAVHEVGELGKAMPDGRN